MAEPEELDEHETAILRRIAANLGHWRRVRRKTQQVLASELEMNLVTIRALEGARMKPSLRTLVHLALVLEIDVAEFFVEREPIDRPTGRPRGS